jgi:hypothetical protein
MPDALKLSLPYAHDSLIVFTGGKQKVFALSGEYGLDLVSHIEEQIRRQSSEHRMLSLVPQTAAAMADRALLAQPQATLEPDALRKADVISVRRLGLALLLRDLECYARELPPAKWKVRRDRFYGLAQRHVITPKGFFEYPSFIYRIFGLMIACGDIDAALALLSRLQRVAALIGETTSAGESAADKFALCKAQYAKALLQTAVQSSTVVRFRWQKRFLEIFEAIHEFDLAMEVPRTLRRAKAMAVELLYLDFGRRPYRDAWLHHSSRMKRNPPVPNSLSIRRLLRLGAIRTFRKSAGLSVPYWPALAFPTRPITLSEMTASAPELLHHPSQLRASLFAMRGARARMHEGFGLVKSDDGHGAPTLIVQAQSRNPIRIAIPSLFTHNDDWGDALAGRPRLTLGRYERIRKLVNHMCEERPRTHYIVFPECSVPRAWVDGIAYKLAQQNISLIGGLEYKLTPRGVRNDVFISLTTRWPWYQTSVTYIQAKCAPSHEERRRLWKNGRKRLYEDQNPIMPIYVHGGFCFGILICSDLTTAGNRTRLQGAVDVLFVVEWNSDIETFSFLVESTAHDLHAYIVQVNNRQFGDSRVRVPRKRDYERDVVRVRGGEADYFVVAVLDVTSLRRFQRKPVFGEEALYKPTPVGFEMSTRRRAFDL